ncbi:MAG TPA: c-type cytochrome [Bryobacteraceae bacterium]|jgi:putative heme-binding domain-containing protein|nr:c-type cytochrome [Bryobacteraceae bacterium]
MSRFFPRLHLSVWSILLAATALPAQADDPALGQQTFSACAGCHGLDGAGGEHAPNIATDPTVQRMTDAALLAIIRDGIPSAGMPGFGKMLNEDQLKAVLTYLRTLQGKRLRADIPGDPTAGRGIFLGRGRCAECHMMNGRGGFLAADLSDYGKSHSPTAIREAIVSPNKNLDARHRTVNVVTKAGQTFRGITRNEDNFSLQMQTPDGILHLFDKRDLARIDYESTSLMPSDYGAKLTPSQIDDLISFLSQTAATTDKRENDDEEE